MTEEGRFTQEDTGRLPKKPFMWEPKHGWESSSRAELLARGLDGAVQPARDGVSALAFTPAPSQRRIRMG